MTEDLGLVCAFLLDGEGGGREIGWTGVAAWNPGQGALWVHLNRDADRATQWLREESGLDAISVDALLADETRPRSQSMGNGLIVILRGVNLNPGAEPEDMVSLRLWIDDHRIISVRLRKLMAVSDIRGMFAANRGPRRTSELLTEMAIRLVDRMSEVIESLDDRTDELEDEMLKTESREIRFRLADIRHEAIVLRRYLAPQRDAMVRLQTEDTPEFDARIKARLREGTDRLVRYIEDLDAIRERASVIQDELITRLSDQMNRTMYVLTVVATIMLPLGFLTGLLGINVGGIPLAESPWGFTVVCAILGVVVAAQVLLFRRLKWI